MKNIIKTITLVGLLTPLTFAGGDITPVAKPIMNSDAVTTNNHFYLGLGASSLALNNNLSKEEFTAKGLTLLTGYAFTQYLAIEGRYTLHLGNLKYDKGTTNNPNYKDYPADFTNLAVYLKPKYDIESFSLYALLGYGEVTLTDLPQPDTTGSIDRAEAGFQWGLGASYEINQNIILFIDYIKMYDDKGFDYRALNANIDSDVWTLGVSYAF